MVNAKAISAARNIKINNEMPFGHVALLRSKMIINILLTLISIFRMDGNGNCVK